MPDLYVLPIINSVPRKYADIQMSFDNKNRFEDGPVFTAGVNRVSQDVVKGMLTKIGSNYLALNYGTIIPDLVGSRSLGPMSAELTNEVQALLGYLGSFNINESLSEQISELISLDVAQNSGTILVTLSVKTAIGEISTVVTT